MKYRNTEETGCNICNTQQKPRETVKEACETGMGQQVAQYHVSWMMMTTMMTMMMTVWSIFVKFSSVFFFK